MGENTELQINIDGWHSIKKLCNKCGAESEVNYDPNYAVPPINIFPCECGNTDFTEITDFSISAQLN